MHVYRRGAVYWYRLRLPADVAHKGAVNGVLRISLRTRCPREARAAAARVHATVWSEIEKMRQSVEQAAVGLGAGPVVPMAKPDRIALISDAEEVFHRALADEEPYYVVYDALHRLDRLRGGPSTIRRPPASKPPVPAAPVASSAVSSEIRIVVPALHSPANDVLPPMDATSVTPSAVTSAITTVTVDARPATDDDGLVVAPDIELATPPETSLVPDAGSVSTADGSEQERVIMERPEPVRTTPDAEMTIIVDGPPDLAAAHDPEAKAVAAIDAGPMPAFDIDAIADAIADRQRYVGLKHPRQREPWTTFLDQFFEAKKLTPSSAHDYRLAYQQLAQITGTIPFAELETGHFSLAVAAFAASGKARAGRKAVAKATQLKRISAYKSIMAWAKAMSLNREGRDALQGITPQNVDRREGRSYKRRAFSQAELSTLISAPIFIGAFSEDRLLRPGRFLYRGPRFWFLLLALCGGWRKSELEVAEVRDVTSEAEIHFLDLHHRAIDLKTDFSPRRVPLLPKVMELGFLDYVEERRREGGEEGRLFPVFDHSKWVNDSFLKKLGIKERTTCLHSLRHNFVQSVDRCFLDRASDRFRFRLTGHVEGDARSRYEGLLSIEDAQTFIEGFKPPTSLDHLVRAPKRIRRRPTGRRSSVAVSV